MIRKSPVSLVSVHNEWDPLEEVIVGRASNARIAKPDHGLFAVEYRDYGRMENIPSGPYDDRVIEETEEDLEELIAVLRRLGVVVRQPEVWDHGQRFSTPDWESDGQYNYCPRDLFVAVGNWIIEAPMTLRARYFEHLPYKSILLECLRSGARWVSAPKPRLLDSAYRLDPAAEFALADAEPVFDAANVLRVGRDVIYLVSDTGNRIGAAWLQSLLGREYRVHTYDNVYSGSHIDTTISLIRPGLVVVNAERVGPDNLPDVFGGWDVIYLSDVVDVGYTGTAYASKWIGLNLFMVRPDLAVVDASQRPLIRELERRGVEVVPLRLRHSRTLGGGFHCVTLDVRRTGSLGSYCRQLSGARFGADGGVIQTGWPNGRRDNMLANVDRTLLNYALIVVVGLVGSVGDILIYRWARSPGPWLLVGSCAFWAVSVTLFGLYLRWGGTTLTAGLILSTLVHLFVDVAADLVLFNSRLSRLEWLGLLFALVALVLLEVGRGRREVEPAVPAASQVGEVGSGTRSISWQSPRASS